MAGPLDDYRRRRWRGVYAVAVGAVAVFSVGVVVGRAATSPPPADTSPPAAAAPTRTVDGVPVGYPRSRAGAVSAAGNYAAVLNSAVVADLDRDHRVLAHFVAPDAVDDVVAALRGSSSYDGGEGVAALADDPDVVMLVVPFGYRVDSYDDDAAVVTVWGSAVGTGPGELALVPDLPLKDLWGTTRLTLRWAGGDWKVADASFDSGPQRPDIASQMRSFTPFWPQEAGP